MRKVEVMPYNHEWPIMFEEETQRLWNIFGDEILDIHHIGSTSVMGLKAKPIIDMLPVVKDIQQIDHYNDAMAEIGYEPKGENGLPGRRYFQKGGDNRSHHVHVYEAGNPEIDRHLAFRDYLRVHPEAVKEYGDLKEALARRYPYDIDSYINGKSQFVRDWEKKALEWYYRESRK